MVVITVKGLSELIQTGRLPLNRKYSEWIQKQVLPVLNTDNSLPDVMEDNNERQEMLPGKKQEKEPFDIAPLFRELISYFSIDALDEMEKVFRKGESKAIKLATASILAEKIKRQFA